MWALCRSSVDGLEFYVKDERAVGGYPGQRLVAVAGGKGTSQMMYTMNPSHSLYSVGTMNSHGHSRFRAAPLTWINTLSNQ